MKGGPSQEPQGFTIVETMIVLAISGALLVSALTLINGRQNRIQFDVAIRQTQQILQSAINEVSSGYYPNDSNSLRCSQTQAPGGTAKPPQIQAIAAKQGENIGCVFLGQVLQLKPASDNSQLYALTVAGNSTNTSSENATNLAEAQPILIYPGTTAGSSAAKSYTATTLQFGLLVTKMYWKSLDASDTTEHDTGSLALLTSFPGSDSNGTVSGSNGVDLYAVDGSALNQSTTALADLVNASGGSNLRRVGSIGICFANPDGSRSGLMTLGGSSGRSGVSLNIKTGSTC